MPDRIPTSRCVPLDSRVEMIANVVNQIVDSGITLTAGDAIDATQLASNIVEVLYDNTTISLNGSGQLQAITASALTEGCGIDITAGVISAAVDGTTIICSGGNLSVGAFNFGTIAVSGQSNVVADVVSDTLTLVAGSNVTITTNAGTDTITIASTDTNTTYTAGAGINLSSTKFVADPHTASHVGLVDPTTGDDSSADDAQIGILWHNIEGFDNGRNQLHGHVADDSTKPKVTAKETEGWLELLESYDSSKHQVIINDPVQTGSEGSEKVRWGDSPQKTLWCIDPDGGHTITTTGTTLTLTLKITKYTFDAVNFTSATDADVTVTYTGTAC